MSARCGNHFRFVAACSLLLLFLTTTGCSTLVMSSAATLGEDMSRSIRDHDDLETVRAGAPAFLLMLDGLIRGHPNDENLLQSAASLYTMYAAVFVDDADRSRRLTERGRNYALRALCLRNKDVCDLESVSFDGFRLSLAACRVGDLPFLYTLGEAWAAWIRSRPEDWNAVAEIPKVEAIMVRVVALDETYEDGGAHLYLGALAAMSPPALGGRPEEARSHFEKALEISQGKNLMVKVLYAARYARPLFDRQLHDRLLNEVLQADPNVPGYVLINTLAQIEARKLLADADRYF